jgi:hypothetical protein
MFRISLSYCLTAAFASGLAPAHARAQEITPQTTAPVTEALIYVATNKGINLYDALSTGKLTLISTTPYQTSGLMIGSNGKTFVTLGTDYIHTYAVASNGAIGKQLSQINTQLYTGSECGTTNGAVYDHSGQYVYVELNGYYDPITGGCAALQTFKLNSTSGLLTFLGSTQYDGDGATPRTPLPTLTASGMYGFTTGQIKDACEKELNTFVRESSGALMETNPTFKPPIPTDGGYYYPDNFTAGPSNYVAVAMGEEYDAPCGQQNPTQVGSFTVGTDGALTTTNTWLNMPTPTINPTVYNMSPSGSLLAIGSNIANSYFPDHPAGLQVLHFNGAKPPTAYSGNLTTAPIDVIHWDTANHLYALSISTGKLYIFTVTTTSITPVVGSPFSIPGANGLFVVPK